jgi:hypothetical protein
MGGVPCDAAISARAGRPHCRVLSLEAWIGNIKLVSVDFEKLSTVRHNLIKRKKDRALHNWLKQPREKQTT